MSTLTQIPYCPPAVSAVFETYPPQAKDLLLAVRTLVFDTAANLKNVGAVTETLKWGEPAYLTKSGTTIRLAWSPKRADSVGLFVNCQTTLVETWREHYGDQLNLVGNREIRLFLDQTPTEAPLRHCIAMALTYHRRKLAR